MNPTLSHAFHQTVSLFKQDPRVIAAYHSGSVGTEREDEYSDVDPVFVIEPQHFESFDHELQNLLEPALGKAILWWTERWIWEPEGRKNPVNPRNYAIFFEMEGQLLQYDINIRATPAKNRIRVQSGQLIFDKAGILEVFSSGTPPTLDLKRLAWTIEMYWIYVYIHTKYLKRRDIFKLLYAQQELFHEHLDVLRFLQPNIDRAWWPLMADQVEKDAQKRLLIYFGANDVDSIARVLPEQVRQFSHDAREACEKWKVEYPDSFERAVLGYLQKTDLV